MYFGGLTYKTSRVYAAAMDALQTVRSVHISGWTTQPGYGKSLETMDLNQRYPMEICEWVTDGNEYRSFYKRGFRINWDDGKRLYQYNENKHQLQISSSRLPEGGLLAYARNCLEHFRDWHLQRFRLFSHRRSGSRRRPGFSPSRQASPRQPPCMSWWFRFRVLREFLTWPWGVRKWETGSGKWGVPPWGRGFSYDRESIEFHVRVDLLKEACAWV